MDSDSRYRTVRKQGFVLQFRENLVKGRPIAGQRSHHAHQQPVKPRTEPSVNQQSLSGAHGLPRSGVPCARAIRQAIRKVVVKQQCEREDVNCRGERLRRNRASFLGVGKPFRCSIDGVTDYLVLWRRAAGQEGIIEIDELSGMHPASPLLDKHVRRFKVTVNDFFPVQHLQAEHERTEDNRTFSH